MKFLFVFVATCHLLYAEKLKSIATLIPEVTSVAAGETFTVALQLKHPEKWHSYYQNSGGIEQPLRIEWQLPPRAKVGEIQWPAPEAKDAYAGKSFIYQGSPIFLIEITTPPFLSVGETFRIQAKAEWQICETSCINEKADFSIELPITEKTTIAAEQSDFFKEARSRLPKPLPSSVKIFAQANPASSNTILLQLPSSKNLPSDFIPNEPYFKSLSEGGTTEKNEKGILLTLPRKLRDAFDEPIPQGNTLSGILIGEQNFSVPNTSISPAPAALLSFGKLFTILWQMFLGGLILNLMPCVFPVIGLKIMGFVQQAGGNRRSIALHGVSFSIGVLASFAIISGLLFTIRLAALQNGTELKGWGYQLQNPWVILSLLLLMFVLALNMFGLFEIGTSATSLGGKWQNQSGHAGSFFSGILATVVATPCSAPFLGTAIGTAIALPANQFFPAFAAMALGLSTPYLFLSFFPQFVGKLPRPGAWMESFKQGMSFLLFATAGYLLWVYSGLIGQENMLAPILGLSCVALAAWIYGRWHLPHRSLQTRFIALAFTTIFALAGIFLSLPKKTQIPWETWSEEKVEKLLSEGKPVYIDFTAQWCLTCQVNKKVAYTKEVLALAEKKGIVFLKADKSAPNPAIERELEELGRSAIPVNVLLLPDDEPILTPELLTPHILKELFEQVP